MKLLKKMMMAAAILLGVCMTATAQEDDYYSFTVKYQGQRPSSHRKNWEKYGEE